MIERDDQVYLGHIRDAIDRIHKYVNGMGESEFSSNSMVQDAVIRQFQVIGEAVKSLSTQMTSRAPATPWSAFAKFRDKLIHQYFGVDLSVVWETIAEDLPSLEESVNALIELHNQ